MGEHIRKHLEELESRKSDGICNMGKKRHMYANIFQVIQD